MASLGSLVVEMSANMARFESDMGKAAQVAARNSEAISQSMQRTEQMVEQSLSRVSQAANIATAAFGALGLSVTADAILKTADAYQGLEIRLRTATAATGDFVQMNQALFDIAQKNGVAFGTTINVFQSLARSQKDLGATHQEMLTLTDTVQKLGVIGGSSTEAMKNGLLQFSQMMSMGTVHAEEWNSIVENMPEMAKRIADGFGLTVGQLKQSINNGKVLSSQVFDALLKQAPEIAKQFESMPITLSRSIVMVENSFQKALGEMDTASGGVTHTLGTGLAFVAENMRSVMTASAATAGILGSIYAGRWLGPLITDLTASTVAWAEYKAAEMQGNVVTLDSAAAKAQQAAAFQEAAAARAQETAAVMQDLNATRETILAARESTTVNLQAAASARERSAAISELAMLGATQARVEEQITAAAEADAVAQRELAIATEQAAAAKTAASVESGILATALNALGGPINAIITLLGLGVTAWVTFGSKARDQLDSIDKKARDVQERLRQLQKANGADDRSDMQAITTELQKQLKLKSEIEQRIANEGATTPSLQLSLDRVNATVKKLQTEQQQLGNLLNQNHQGQMDLPNTTAGIDPKLAHDLDALKKHIASKREIEEKDYKDSEALINKAAAQGAISAQQKYKLLEQLEKHHQDRMADIKKAEDRRNGIKTGKVSPIMQMQAQLDAMGPTDKQTQLKFWQDKAANLEIGSKPYLEAMHRVSMLENSIHQDHLRDQQKYAREVQAVQDRIAAINADAATIGMTNAQREIANQLSQMEHKGIRKGTPKYDELKGQIETAVNNKYSRQESVDVSRWTEGQLNAANAIKFQADMIGKTALEQKILTAQRQIDLDVAQRSIGVLDSTQKKYRLEGEIAKENIAIQMQLADARERAWGAGVQTAVLKYADTVQNAAALAENFYTNVFKSMEDTLFNFFKTGKIGWRDFADSVINELLRIEAKKAALALIGDGKSSDGWLTKGLNALTGMVGAGSGTTAPAPSYDFSDTPLDYSFGGGHALGGSVNPFSMNMVNERGPEVLSMGGRDFLMMGSRGGNVIPNGELGGSGAATPVFNFNIDARGADIGVEQRLTAQLQQLKKEVPDLVLNAARSSSTYVKAFQK